MRRLIREWLILAFLGSMILLMGCGGPATEPIEKLAEANISNGTIPAGQTTDMAVPEWFVDVSKVTGYLCAVGTAQSRDMQMALDTAKHYARIEMAKQVEVRIERSRRGTAESDKTPRRTIVSKRTTSEGSTIVSKEITSDGSAVVFRETAPILVLRGCRVSKQDIRQEGSLYRAYVLMEMPAEEAEPKADEALYVQPRALQPLEETDKVPEKQWLEDLEKEMEKYERWKRKRGG